MYNETIRLVSSGHAGSLHCHSVSIIAYARQMHRQVVSACLQKLSTQTYMYMTLVYYLHLSTMDVSVL